MHQKILLGAIVSLAIATLLAPGLLLRRFDRSFKSPGTIEMIRDAVASTARSALDLRQIRNN